MSRDTGKSDNNISTSQLAKRQGMESRELFELLSGAKWIVRNHEDTPVMKGKPAPKWLLTAKGEFEGGRYFTSDKFGTYIVWPETVVDHPMLRTLQDKPLTATQIGKAHQIPGRLVNRILNELGWIEAHIDGWELTNAGAAVGGQSRESDKTGIHYAVWPQTVVQDPALQHRLDVCDLNDACFDCGAKAQQPNTVLTALDGHQHDCRQRTVIDNWLYLNNIAHACGRLLTVNSDSESTVTCDFYIPHGRIFIEYWGAEGSDGDGAQQLLNKLQKLDYYRETQANLIEIEPEHLPQLDDYLAKQLLKFGIKVYA